MTYPSPLAATSPARHPMLEREPERDLLESAQLGDRVARDLLVTSHLRLVRSIAQRNGGRGAQLDDAIHEGVLGLLEAIDRFDMQRDNRFSTYAAYWVYDRVRRHSTLTRAMVSAPSSRGARLVLRGYRRASDGLERRLGRAPTRGEVAQELGVGENEVAACEPALRSSDVYLDGFEAHDSRREIMEPSPTPEQAVAEAETAQARERRVAQALSVLAPRERWIIERRFLDDDATSLTDLGASLGISRERARQIQEGARNKLRKALAS